MDLRDGHGRGVGESQTSTRASLGAHGSRRHDACLLVGLPGHGAETSLLSDPQGLRARLSVLQGQSGASASVVSRVLGLLPPWYSPDCPPMTPCSCHWAGLQWPRVAGLSLNEATKHWSQTGPQGTPGPTPRHTPADFMDKPVEALGGGSCPASKGMSEAGPDLEESRQFIACKPYVI